MNVLQAMKTYVAVVDAGSFVGAMSATGLSKPAVSRQIADLEAMLGGRLLQRTTRRLSVTSEGRTYYQRCKDILQAVDEAQAEVVSATAQAQGRLRIGAPLTFGVLHLAPLWSRFMDANPQVTLDIVLADRVFDPVEEGYDIVVRIGRPLDVNLVGRPLARSRMVLCASPGYLARCGTPAHPLELEHHEVILYSYSPSGDTWNFTGPQGRISVPVHARIIANNGDTCRIAALSDQGVILQPDFLVHDDLRTGRLVQLLPDFGLHELSIQALYPTRKQLPLKVRKLVDFLVAAFRDPVWSAEQAD